MSLLELRALSVAYGGVVAVRDVSLSVSPGEVVAVLGANGAGKTTTLLAVSGLVPVRSGEVLLDGEPVAGRSPEEIARRGVAHVLAERGAFPGLTIAENLRMGLYGAGRDGTSEGVAALDRVLELFPVLAERRSQPAGTLSGGQAQQLVIARALVQSPRLLLLDEMSMGLSPTVVADLFAIVGDLRSEGIAVVMVEQFVGQALAVADRAVVLEQGRVVSAGTPDELSGEALASAYLGADDPGARPLPGAPSTAREQLAVRLAGRDVRALELLARDRGRSVDDTVAELVEQALERGPRR